MVSNSSDSNTQYSAKINNMFESLEIYYFDITYDDGNISIFKDITCISILIKKKNVKVRRKNAGKIKLYSSEYDNI